MPLEDADRVNGFSKIPQAESSVLGWCHHKSLCWMSTRIGQFLIMAYKYSTQYQYNYCVKWVHLKRVWENIHLKANINGNCLKIKIKSNFTEKRDSILYLTLSDSWEKFDQYQKAKEAIFKESGFYFTQSCSIISRKIRHILIGVNQIRLCCANNYFVKLVHFKIVWNQIIIKGK